MGIEFNFSENGEVILVLNNKPLCLIDTALEKSNVPVKSRQVNVKGEICRWEYEDATITDHVKSSGTDFAVLERTWELKGKGDYICSSSFTPENEKKAGDMMIPGIWYQGNVQGKGEYPSSETAVDWSFLETRMAIPCCIQLGEEHHFFTCAATPADNRNFLASCRLSENSINITIPGSEDPISYQGKQNRVKIPPTPGKYIRVENDPVRFSRKFFLSIPRIAQNRYEAYRIFVEAITPYSGKRKKTISWNKYGAYKFTRLLNLVKRASNGKAYVKMGEGNGNLQEHYNFTSASFLVKSLEAAVLLLHEDDFSVFEPEDYQKARQSLAERFNLPDDSLLLERIAILIGEYFLSYEIEKGVHQDCVDLTTCEFGGYLGIGEHDDFKDLLNSRCNGESMKFYVLLYRELQNRGMEKPEFLELAKRVARFYLVNQLPNGSFGRWWTTSGEPVNTEGTNGAHIGCFLVKLLDELEENDVLYDQISAACDKAIVFYTSLVNEGKFYGDTLDADSFDKEAGVVLLEFFLDMYELKNEQEILMTAMKAADFLLTWIWQFNSFLPGESDLVSHGFSTKGMTSVSVAHNHLDFYGIYIAYDFLRLAKYADSDFFRDQGKLMADACRQLISLPSDRLGRSEYYSGWQPEQINHTSWDYFNCSERMNGSFYIDVAWVTVLGLGGYLLLLEDFPSILE